MTKKYYLLRREKKSQKLCHAKSKWYPYRKSSKPGLSKLDDHLVIKAMILQNDG